MAKKCCDTRGMKRIFPRDIHITVTWLRPKHFNLCNKSIFKEMSLIFLADRPHKNNMDLIRITKVFNSKKNILKYLVPTELMNLFTYDTALG